jgi:hypothetical protein
MQDYLKAKWIVLVRHLYSAACAFVLWRLQRLRLALTEASRQNEDDEIKLGDLIVRRSEGSLSINERLQAYLLRSRIRALEGESDGLRRRADFWMNRANGIAVRAGEFTRYVQAFNAEVRARNVAPGTTLRRFLGTLYGPKAMERIFDPIIADMQQEWRSAAEINTRSWYKTWLRIRACGTVAQAIYSDLSEKWGMLAFAYSLYHVVQWIVGLFRGRH